MSEIHPSKETQIIKGDGPEKSVCLIMNACGIGDDLHALPVVWRMIQDGCDVTVYTKPFEGAIWESIGARVLLPPTGGFQIDFDEQAKKQYGLIAKLRSWSTWQVPDNAGLPMGTIDYFASLLDATVPDSFSWIDILQPNLTIGEPYVLLATESAEVWRTLPEERAFALYDELSKEHNVIWLTHGGKLMPDEQIEALAYHLRLYHKSVMITQHSAEPLTEERIEEWAENLRSEKRKEVSRMKERTHCRSFRELLNLVYNAERVYSVENGVSNLAGALGRELTVICGMTEPTNILGQYKKFNPSWSYEVITGEYPNNGICKGPCWRRSDRGMLRPNGSPHELCCGYAGAPLCLHSLDVTKIVYAHA